MVRSRMLAVLALVSAGWGVPSASAYSGPPVGRGCAFNSVTDVTREPGFQIGHVNGGPVAHPEAGTVTCSIQVNGFTHAAPDVVRHSGTTGLVSVLAPTPVSFRATAADVVTSCTEYTSGSGTWYWVGESWGRGEWVTDPEAPCSVLGPADANRDVCPVLLTVDGRAGTSFAETWQDCEPYEPIV